MLLLQQSGPSKEHGRIDPPFKIYDTLSVGLLISPQMIRRRETIPRELEGRELAIATGHFESLHRYSLEYDAERF